MELAKEKESIFCTFYFVRRKFFNIWVLPQCIVYWIHFQNINTFAYEKKILHTPFCLFLKSSKAFSVSLRSSKINKHLDLCPNDVCGYICYFYEDCMSSKEGISSFWYQFSQIDIHYFMVVYIHYLNEKVCLP